MCQMEMGIYVFVIERTPRAEGNKSSIRVPTEHVGVVVAGGKGPWRPFWSRSNLIRIILVSRSHNIYIN